MKGKNLLILVVLAVILTAAAVLVRRKDVSPPPEEIGKLLMPDLAVNDIEKVVMDTGSATTTLAKVEGRWVCRNRHDYPIDFGKLSDVLVDLYEVKIANVVPGASERLGSLGLKPPAPSTGEDEPRSGTLVKLFFKGKTEPRSVLLGKAHMKKPTGEAAAYGSYPDGRYVSTDDGKTAYLIPETLDDLTLDDPTQWLDSDLLSVSSSDIMEISVTGPGRDAILVSRKDKSSDLEVQGLKDDEEADTSKLNSINGALSYLRLNDVAGKSLPPEQVGMTSAVVFKVTTKKDQIYTVRVGSSPDDSSDYHIQIDVAMAQPSGEKVEEVEEGDEKTDEQEKTDEEKAEEEKKEREKTEAAVEKLQKKLSGWTFLVSSYKAESFKTKRSDLVKKKKKEEEKKDKANKED